MSELTTGDLATLGVQLLRMVEMVEAVTTQREIFFFTAALATFNPPYEPDTPAGVPSAQATLKFIFERYDDVFKALDTLPWYVRILEVSPLKLPDAVLYDIYRLTRIRYLDIAMELVKTDDIAAVQKLRRLDRMFPEQDGKLYEQLLAFSETLQSNRNFETFEPLLREHIVAQRPVAPEPTYLLDPPDLAAAPAALLEAITTATNAGVAATPELLTAGASAVRARLDAIDTVEEVLTSTLTEPPLGREIARIIARFRLGTNLDLFRLFGPVNTQVNDRLDIDDICSIYGGCRMLTCNCFEGITYDSSDDRDGTWFTGYCKNCLDRISNQRAAFRVPLPVGGWIGCYCSPACAANDASEYVTIIHADNIVDLTATDVVNLREAAALLLTDSINVVALDLTKNGLYRYVPNWVPKTSQLAPDDEPVPLEQSAEETYLTFRRLFDQNTQIENDVLDEQTLNQRFPGALSLLA